MVPKFKAGDLFDKGVILYVGRDRYFAAFTAYSIYYEDSMDIEMFDKFHQKLEKADPHDIEFDD